MLTSLKTIIPCSAAKMAFTAAIFLGAVSLLTLTHGQSLAETAGTTATVAGGALLAGGSDGTNRLATAEVFNAADGTFALTTDLFPTTGTNMSEPRVGAGAIRLANGRILIAGGIGPTGLTFTRPRFTTPTTGVSPASAEPALRSPYAMARWLSRATITPSLGSGAVRFYSSEDIAIATRSAPTPSSTIRGLGGSH